MRPPPPLPLPSSSLSKQQHLRISRCLPPVWRNAAHAQAPPPPPAPPATPLVPSSLSALLFSCTNRSSRRSGEQVHARAVPLGLAAHPSVLPRLVTFYITLGDLPAARAAVEQATGRARAFPWNLLIWGYAAGGHWEDVILAYKKMLALGVVADKFTYPSVLRACGELRETTVGREIEQRLWKYRYGLDMYVWNALLGMYAKCGELDDARRVFDGMPGRDVVSWNTMVATYSSLGICGEELLERVPGANIATWNTVAVGNLKAGNHAKVTRLVSRMRSPQGPGLDFVTLVIGLKACGRGGYLRIGREVHGVAVRLCFDRLERVENSLITMYSRCRMIGCAYQLFKTSSSWSISTWNSLLAGHLCCGMEMHCYILKRGLGGSNLLQNSLVDMYSKSRQLAAAQKVFDQMQCQDKNAYTSLILGHGLQREGHVSLKLFGEMISNDIEVDHVTMVAVLSACSHSGLVTQGQLLFTKMVDVFCIAPRVEHYSCMVDLYSREGLVRMAEEIIEKMPCPPTAAMLATLIEACRVHGKIEIGDRAAKQLLAMRTRNPGHYKLIANLYISAKCWPKLAKVRSLMGSMELDVIPTHTLLESEYDMFPAEHDDYLNHDMYGGLSDDMTY